MPVESVVHAVENIEGLRIDPHKVSVPAPHRIRLLGVHPDRLWWYETGRKGEGWEGREERGFGYICNLKSTVFTKSKVLA